MPEGAAPEGAAPEGAAPKGAVKADVWAAVAPARKAPLGVTPTCPRTDGPCWASTRARWASTRRACCARRGEPETRGTGVPGTHGTGDVPRGNAAQAEPCGAAGKALPRLHAEGLRAGSRGDGARGAGAPADPSVKSALTEPGAVDPPRPVDRTSRAPMARGKLPRLHVDAPPTDGDAASRAAWPPPAGTCSMTEAPDAITSFTMSSRVRPRPPRLPTRVETVSESPLSRT